MAFHDPRPFITTAELESYDCSAEHGNPSGHSMASSCFTSLLILHYYTASLTKNKLKYILLAILAILWTYLVVYSRIYNAAHSIDQVVFGVSLGYYFAFGIHFYM
jgi:membrane-associated phospholipid phosphatase